MKTAGAYFIAYSFGYYAHATGTPYWYLIISIPFIIILEYGLKKILVNKSITHL